MFINKVTVWCISSILLLCVLMIACAPERESSNDVNGNSDLENGGMPDKPDELLVWINDNEEDIEAAEKITEAYTKDTGIEIKLESVAEPDQVQKLSLAGPTGDAPDLFYQPQDRLGDIVLQGLADPMEFTEEELNEFSDSAIESVTYEGDIYGSPAIIDTYFVYYNKSLIDSPPETLDEVFEISEELTDRDNDEYGFLAPAEFYYLYPFISSYGGYIFGEENGTYDITDIGLANEGAVEGLKKYKEFLDKDLLPKTITVDVLDGLFTEGKVGMVLSGPWSIPYYKDALGDDLGTARLPEINGDIAPSFVGVKSWFVSSFSDHSEWATDLAKFMTNDENSDVIFESTGELPPRQDLIDQIDDPIYDGYTEQVPYGIAMPNIPEMSAVWDMDNAIELIINGDDVEDVIKSTVEIIEVQISLSGE